MDQTLIFICLLAISAALIALPAKGTLTCDQRVEIERSCSHKIDYIDQVSPCPDLQDVIDCYTSKGFTSKRFALCNGLSKEIQSTKNCDVCSPIMAKIDKCETKISEKEEQCDKFKARALCYKKENIGSYIEDKCIVAYLRGKNRKAVDKLMLDCACPAFGWETYENLTKKLLNSDSFEGYGGKNEACFKENPLPAVQVEIEKACTHLDTKILPCLQNKESIEGSTALLCFFNSSFDHCQTCKTLFAKNQECLDIKDEAEGLTYRSEKKEVWKRESQCNKRNGLQSMMLLLCMLYDIPVYKQTTCDEDFDEQQDARMEVLCADQQSDHDIAERSGGHRTRGAGTPPWLCGAVGLLIRRMAE